MPRGKGKHLDISDRVTIEKSIKSGEPLSQIARLLGVSTSTVSREIKQNRTRYLVRASPRRELCVHWADCTVTRLCDAGCARTACKRCASSQCTTICPEWEERTCELLDRAPFVCGQREGRANCGLGRAKHGARDAQTKYERRLCESRSGVSVTPEQLESMVAHARRLMAQGHSIEAIWSEHPDLFPVSARTFRNYVDRGVFGLANIELPKKARYKPRRKNRAAAGGCVDATGSSFCPKSMHF